MANIFKALKSFAKLSQNVVSSVSHNTVIIGELAEIDGRIEKIEKELIELVQRDGNLEDAENGHLLVELILEKQELEKKRAALDRAISEKVKSDQVVHDEMVLQIAVDLELNRLSDGFAKNITPIFEFLSSRLEQAYNQFSGRQFHYSKACADSFLLSDDNKTQIGDAFELFLGRQYEKLGLPVLFNGIVKRKLDNGVDLIVFNPHFNSAIYIQVKNWYQRKFDLSELNKVYTKLTSTPVTYYAPDLQLQNRLTSFQGSSRVDFASLINKLPSMSIEKILYLPCKNNITDEVARLFEQGEYRGMKLRFHNQQFKNAFGIIYR